MTNINSLVVTREVMQWAAVTTHLELTRVPENGFLKFIGWKGKILIRPPQKKPELGCDLRLMRAIHGYSFTLTIIIDENPTIAITMPSSRAYPVLGLNILQG